MSTVNDQPHTGKGEDGNLYGEADKLLRLAEELQEKCERYERRLWAMRALGGALTLACLAVAVSLTIGPLSGSYSWAIFAYFYAFFSFVFLLLFETSSRAQLTRERRALHSIVDMLRELEKGIAEQNNLSTLERAEFRIRLSRFDIGPGW